MSTSQEPIMSEAEQNSLDERSPEQREFEQWYVENSFNYARDPIGSNNCYLQRLAWNSSRGRLLADLTALRTANEGLRKELEAARADAARYSYVIDFDYRTALVYLPDSVESLYKAEVRRRHDAAIAQEAKP